MERDNPKFEIPDDSNIDTFCEILIEKLFNIEGALLTNESTLHNFIWVDDIPGHRLMRVTDIPLDDRKIYLEKMPNLTSIEKTYDWYPPVSDQEWEEITKKEQEDIFQKIESIFGVSMKDYEDEELYVWKVADYIQKEKLSRWKD